ncbi:MAG TPA: 50S ribosomal protein L23 [Tepidisphaeraceae bacterium]|jgi:large subunit ribosomal protein L23
MAQRTLHETDVIIKPLITEKSTHQANTRNTYAFHVHPKADKLEIKAAVEKLYNVKVADVRTLNRKAKARRTKVGYITGSSAKRAIVKLEGESKIELF